MNKIIRHNKAVMGLLTFTALVFFSLFLGINVSADETASLNYSELSLFPGQEIELKLDGKALNISAVQYSSDNTGLVTVDESGKVQATTDTDLIQNSEGAVITATYTYKSEEEELNASLTCKVSVSVPQDPDFGVKPLGAGFSRKLKYSVTDTFTDTVCSWVTEDKSIASIDETGKITGKKAGDVRVGVRFTCGTSYYDALGTVTITKAKPVSKKVAINYYNRNAINVRDFLENISENSKITELKSSKTQYIKVNKKTNTFKIKKKGKNIKISCKVDGVPVSFKVYVTKARPSNSAFDNTGRYGAPGYVSTPVILYNRQRKTLKAEGTLLISTKSFRSENPKIVKVTKKGTLKAMKEGSTHVVMEIDHFEYRFLVTVTTKEVAAVLNRAVDVIGCTYSQARRMEKGYYDCSSLVWRVYSPSGITFGYPSWAPTADMEAQYMANHGKIIAWKGVPYKKLKPGDIIFFGGYYDWQYRTIGHVAIYVGGDTIVHASGGGFGVIESNYTDRRQSIVAIARPF